MGRNMWLDSALENKKWIVNIYCELNKDLTILKHENLLINLLDYMEIYSIVEKFAFRIQCRKLKVVRLTFHYNLFLLNSRHNDQIINSLRTQLPE